MPVSPLQAPPVDNSGGIMHVRFVQNDRMVFIQRLHLNTNVDSAVATAFGAYADVVKAYYDGDWKIQLTALDELAGGVPFRVPTPVATARTGTGGTATTGIAALTETIFTFKTAIDGPAESRLFARVRFVGIGGSVPATQENVSASAGGSATDQDLVEMLTNAANHFVSHGGQPLLAPATKSTGLWKDERRRAMRKA
jgi:hypothetical protein